MDPITVTAFAFSLASYHFDRSVKHNEINPGVFVEVNHAYVGGVYLNSLDHTTVLLARQFRLGEVGPVGFGALAGVCTGYHVPVCGGLTSSLGPVTLMFIPPIPGKTDATGVIGLSIRKEIK